MLKLVDLLDRLRQRRTDVRVRVHRAWLFSPYKAECYFINVWNASPERDVTVTHVWVDADPHVAVMTKPLPARVAPRSQWETWVEVAHLPAGLDDVEHLARAQLADGRVLKSVPREDMPPAGYVPG